MSAAAGYLVVREFQCAVYRVHFPWLSATVGGVPFFLACLRIGRRVGNAIVGRSAPRWVEELAVRHRVPIATLAEYKDVL